MGVSQGNKTQIGSQMLEVYTPSCARQRKKGLGLLGRGSKLWEGIRGGNKW